MNALSLPVTRLAAIATMTAVSTLLTTKAFSQEDPCVSQDALEMSCVRLNPITIVGTREDARDIAGGATVVTAEDLEEFEPTDVTRALHRVPGVSVQLEDGYGLRPNISIRGTPSERSSRITLLEDNVLVAPAPYSAPAAYYFPTFGRISGIEVLKGPAAITQGPYTIGGALNLLSTPIPNRQGGLLQAEIGSDSTWRVHGWYGGENDRAGWLVETHQWQSDGFQDIDRSSADSGLDKSDYLAKFRLKSSPDAPVYQQFDLKLQTSDEDSEQSYLGLADADFFARPTRRYGLSAEDLMHNEHDQIVASWRIEPTANLGFVLTAYDQDFERAWYKTEGIDFDGSSDPESFQRTSWATIIDAVNRGESINGVNVTDLQAILDGADTAMGSLQLRNNARAYTSQGVQLSGDAVFGSNGVTQTLKFGLRYHEDSEDRLQRNDTWQQLNGQLVLNARGIEGNAGNRIQDAKAWAAYVQDRIEWGRWTLTPGIRFESIEQTRTDFGAADSLSGRDPEDVSRVRSNSDDVWIPGIGALFQQNANLSWLAGVHKGFSAPGNQDGVDPEESVNYEAGLRYGTNGLQVEAIAFYNDYENLQGVCTASSGTNCDIGDVFNGDAVSVPGLEFSLSYDLAEGRDYSVPVLLTYTWMDAEFDSDIDDSEFFGDVSAGDPVPYIPDNQLYASIGLEQGPWESFLSASYVDSVCTRASCDRFERTESSLVFDAAVHYRFNDVVTLYAVVENLTDAQDLVAREPYGARPEKSRTWLVGTRLSF